MDGTREGTSSFRRRELFERKQRHDDAIEGFDGDGGDGDDGYKAFRTMRQGTPGISVEMADGSKRHISYGLYAETIYRYHKAMAIVYTTCVVTIQGQHLDALYERMCIGDVSRIIEFHPGIHEMPVEGEPLITHLKVTPHAELRHGGQKNSR